MSWGTCPGTSLMAAHVAVSSNGASSNGTGKLPALDIPKPKASKRWALQESEFGQGLVGGKSSNLAFLRAKVSRLYLTGYSGSYICAVHNAGMCQLALTVMRQDRHSAQKYWDTVWHLHGCEGQCLVLAGFFKSPLD